MRKSIIAGFLVLTCLIVVAALNVNYLVEHNRDYLLGRLGGSLGHSVKSNKVEISYMPFAVHLTDLTIAGTAADATSPLVVAKDVLVTFHVLPLLLGQLQPEKIVLDSPVIKIVGDADGGYNYEPPTTKKRRARAQTSRSEGAANDPGLFAIPALQVTNGTLRYRDLRSDAELTIAQIELTVSDIATDKPIEIDLTAAVMTDKPNLKFKTRIGPITGIRDYRDYPIDGALDAQQLDLGKVNRTLPKLRKATPKHLRFDGIYDFKDIKFKGTLNHPSLKGAVSGTDASFRLE